MDKRDIKALRHWHMTHRIEGVPAMKIGKNYWREPAIIPEHGMPDTKQFHRGLNSLAVPVDEAEPQSEPVTVTTIFDHKPPPAHLPPAVSANHVYNPREIVLTRDMLRVAVDALTSRSGRPTGPRARGLHAKRLDNETVSLCITDTMGKMKQECITFPSDFRLTAYQAKVE